MGKWIVNVDNCEEIIQEPEANISFWGSFESPDLEGLFREQQQRRDIKQISVVLVLATLFTLAFSPTDRHLLGPGPVSRLLLGGRLVLAALATILLLFCRRALEPSARDRVLFLFGLCCAAFMIGLGATRPSMYFLGYMLTEIYALSLLYFVSPLPLPMKAALGALFTGNDAFLLITRHSDLDPVLLSAAAAAYLTTNTMGILVSWNVGHLQREQFAMLRRLEESLGAVKTLRGILSICSHCKKIRSDMDVWEVVEEYVRDRTHAEFSHGICPGCMVTIYGNDIGQM